MSEVAALPLHLFLTGSPGVGKTTAIRRAVERLDDLRASGFYTEEIRGPSGRRTGFLGVTLRGRERVIASVEIEGRPRVGKYGVDVPAVDALTASALDPDAGTDVYVVDEVGKMECFSGVFRAAIRRLLEGETPLVGTVARRGGGLIEEVREHPAVEVRELTRGNRDELPGSIEAWVRERAGDGAG